MSHRLLIDAPIDSAPAPRQPDLGFEPFGPRVIVRIDEAATFVQAGDVKIELPDNAQEKPYTGIIVAVGPGATWATVGQRVLFEKYVGVEFELEGEILLALKESEIIGRFRPKLT